MPLGNGVRSAFDPLKDLDEERIGSVPVIELQVKGIAAGKRAAPFQRPDPGIPAASRCKLTAAALGDRLGVGVDKATVPVGKGGMADDTAIQDLRLWLWE